MNTEAEPTRPAQVFATPLANAAKYSGEGTRIRFRAHADHAHVRIGITDERIGISREMLDKSGFLTRKASLV